VSQIIILALLFLIGYSSQRSGVCMVRAVREVIVRRRAHRFAGFALAAASAMLVMALTEALGAAPFEMIAGARADGLAVAGGVLFGLGARVNGHCAMGTLAALTAGQLSRVATIAAMLVAALLLGPNMSRAALMVPERELFGSPLIGNTPLALVVGAVLALLAASYLHRRLDWRKPRGGWSPLIAMSLIGAASGSLFALDQRWVYTSRIAELAYGTFAITPLSLIPLAVLIGAMVLAAVTGGQFRLLRGTLREWLAAGAGGLLMGLGATLVPGGNDTMLFTGVPLLLPNLLVAYAAFVATLVFTTTAPREQEAVTPPPAA
jgi:uncharacterized membrane protein YedE/YeeE